MKHLCMCDLEFVDYTRRLLMLYIEPMNGSANDTSINISLERIAKQHVTAVTIASLLLIISVYLFLVTILYEVKVSQARKLQSGNHRGSKNGSNYFCKVWNTAADRIRFLIVISVSSIMIRQTLEIVELQFSTKSDVICNNLRAIKNILYVFCISPLYIILWMRQRMFYTSRLQNIFNKFVKTLSASVIVIMIIGNIIGISLFLGTRKYASHPTGCVIASSTVNTKLPGAVLLGCTVIFQIILLFLFLYPLILHKKDAERLDVKNSNIWNVIRRICILTTLTVIFDVSAAVVTLIIDDLVISVFRQLVYDVSLFVACICVILAFNDWKQRLFPFLSQTDSAACSTTPQNSQKVTSQSVLEVTTVT